MNNIAFNIKLYIKFLPLFICTVALAFFCYYFYHSLFITSNLSILEEGKLTKAQELSVTMTIELNKYMISITTALFGLLSYILSKYSQDLSFIILKIAFLLSMIMLGLGSFYAFRIYVELANNLYQGVLSLEPGNSKLVAYIELEFILCMGASLTLSSFFVVLQFYK